MCVAVVQLQIRTFGEFSLRAGEKQISDRDNRSRKVWSLLAYLLCRRERVVSQSELIEQIWGNDPSSDNPENALKVTLHRARSMLDKLWAGAGHDLILRRSGGYAWNREIPVWLDAEEFEALCEKQAGLPEMLEAMELYRGEFLGKLSSGAWVIPISTHYHNLYIRSLLAVLSMLAELGENQKIVELCRCAIPVEPYNEEISCALMTALLALGDQTGAAGVYERLRERLFHDFGITPSEKARGLYRKASQAGLDKTMPIETVLEHLLERDPEAGALPCDFDCFQVLCIAEARAMVRSGDATHVALLSVSGEGERVLSRRSLDRGMEALGEQIRLNLRRGDAFSKCSASQYVIMLPRANYENSCVVCRRVIGAFTRRYPHMPIQIHFLVRPLTPMSPEFRAAEPGIIDKRGKDM